MGKYVDDYKNDISRVEVICPYCGGLHTVSAKAENWGCRDCGNDFAIPLAAKIPIIKLLFTFEGNKNGV